MESDTITIKKDSLWKYATFALIAIVILLVAFFVLPGKSSAGNAVNNGQQLPAPTASAKVQVDTDGDPIKGDSNAPVEFVEFTDYECPFCQRHFLQTGGLLDDRIQDGDIKLVTKDYPLPFHPQAQKAAEAAHCARDQGGDEAYYKMHDMLFSNGVVGGVATFEGYAQEIGLDVNEFSSCLDSDRFADEVQADLEYGSQVGVQGTPAFFINGRIISGACPATTFAQAIDAEVSGEEWAVTNCQFFSEDQLA